MRRDRHSAEREERAIREEEERIRLENRTLYERIEECESMRDVKDILHFMVDMLDDCLASRGDFPPPTK